MVDLFNIDLCGIIQAQGQLIAMDPQLHGVAHRSQADHGDLSAGDHTHVQKMLAERPLASHSQDPAALTGLQFTQ